MHIKALLRMAVASYFLVRACFSLLFYLLSFLFLPMESTEIVGKSMVARSKEVVKRIIKQALGLDAKEESDEYIWVCQEVQKESKMGKGVEFLQSLIRNLGAWYEEHLETDFNKSVGIFYVRMAHFLYTMQYKPMYLLEEVSASLLKIEMPYLVFTFLTEYCLVDDVRDILGEMIDEESLIVVFSWKEYRYAKSKKCKVAEETLKRLFLPESAISPVLQHYYREKEAFIDIESLME